MTTPASVLKGRLRSTPLRFKLVTAVLALVAAALLVISVMTTFFLRNYLVSQVDSELHTSARTLQTLMAEANSGTVGLPLADYIVVLPTNQPNQVYLRYDTGRFSPADLPPWPADAEGFAKLQGDPITVGAHDGKVRWRMLYTKLPNGQMVAIGQHLTDVDEAVEQLIWIDLVVGGTVLILLASLGAAIVRTSLRPLDKIEQTAAAIADGDLTRRVPDPEPGEAEAKTELGRLSRALNAMLTQIEAAFTARAASEAAARNAELGARDAAFAAQASEARARRSEERMRQFVADASHELRTPLTTIRGFAELYRQGAAGSPEETARLVRRIEDEASRMGLLVEDLLLLARLDRERPLVLGPVELPVLATEAVQAAQAIAPERKIFLEVVPGSGDLVVLADDARLRQVLGNLMTNAITHTPPDASVTLRLRADTGNVATVEVADTGPGLAPEQAERVFERFYRADAARTRRADGATGTGLGLAIVAALVAAHHGSVEVLETPGGGATFRVKLPLAPGTPDSTENE
ncbi:two-component system OmpR family sensor kinase [Micromonospora pisi]|uniref:histidine kinase n=1 Tax=Micromonospora pisi TaxID=589240 RepID=A0A495JI16_9ACTN|nr:HAMP domain-containing sensor histidine kinase [Micromonospora pisi]RKR88208.1 two-component system OmpR family sensor kinase [Micromonospora pisi]